MDMYAKQAVEDFTRAQSYLKRNDLLRAIQSGKQAFATLLEHRVVGKDKFVVETHLRNFLAAMNNHPEVANYYSGKVTPPYFNYGQGKDKLMLAQLIGMERDLAGAENFDDNARVQKKALKMEELLEKGQELLEQGEYPRAKGFLRRAVEAQDGVALYIDVAKRLARVEQYMDAAQILEKAIKRFPSEAEPYSIAVKIYIMGKEYARAENIYMQAYKRFGPHPKTYLGMAKLYLAWRKFEKAYDFAKEALKADPDSAEAKKILKETEKKVFISYEV